MLYDNTNTARTSVTVPDLNLKTSAQAQNALLSLNLNVSIDGTGTVVSQDLPANSKVIEKIKEENIYIKYLDELVKEYWRKEKI